jgi:glycosyltransferase involved in cell wall biosynthesis
LTKIRLAVINNYDLERVENEVNNNEVPEHLLFGTNYLRGLGHTVTFFSTTKSNQNRNYRLSNKFFSILHINNVEVQREIFKRKTEFDFILCLCGEVSEWLYLKSLKGQISIPILTLYHHPLPKGILDPFRNLFRKLLFCNQKKILCLSRSVASSYNRVLGKNVAESIAWGVDYKFYDRITNNKCGGKNSFLALSCGRTSRDISTFCSAIQIARVHGHVICQKDQINSDIVASKFLSIETTNYSGKTKDNTYHMMAKMIESVRVIAIPLEKQETLAGLTSLLDCLGFGKPVIMTRNPCIDIDIEKEGIGIWVNPYDIDDWVNALKWYSENELEAKIMGQRAKEFATRYSSRNFAVRLHKTIIDHYQN